MDKILSRASHGSSVDDAIVTAISLGTFSMRKLSNFLVSFLNSKKIYIN